MSSDGSFNRILTLLRKERGITQKEAAANLGVSQALLSHYEKGIRECGLDFVVKAADYYGVSCDYLLGRSPDRNGLTLSVDELPVDINNPKDSKFRGNMTAVLNKKVLINSISFLFEYIQTNKSRKLAAEVSNYLYCALYKMFRTVYSGNPKNQQKLFSLPEKMYSGYVDASMKKSEANLEDMLSDDPAGGEKVDTESLQISGEDITNGYSQVASSLFSLIQQTEKQAKK